MMQPAQYRPTIDVPCPFNSARYLCLSADRTNQPFSISVLPRGARRCWSVANAHRSKSLTKSLGHFSFAQVAFEGDTLYETPVSSRKVAVNLLGVASPASAMPLSHAAPAIAGDNGVVLIRGTVAVMAGEEAAEVTMVGLADEDITTGSLADAIADGTNLKL